ncbi:MAG TPA: glycosyl hydrolase family 28-related protein, partial [Armatimonadota bacterium]
MLTKALYVFLATAVWGVGLLAFPRPEKLVPSAASPAAAQTTPTVTSRAVTVVNVTAFGAKGDGVTDDRPAIQAAIDALTAKQGGILRIPKGTYLLNSYRPGAHPWGFHNLLVGSRIRIEGEPGATLLQGERGR